MEQTPPVLLLAFNRPAQVQAALARLRHVRPPKMYVHVDGARADKVGEAERVAEVQRLIREGIDWDCSLQTMFREANAGLRKGVPGAIDWFFEQEPWGVVLEDDCLPDPSFFRFAAELLERYAEDERVMHIGGSNLMEQQTQQLAYSYSFTRFSFVWGWAGWRRAWKHFSASMDNLETYVDSPLFIDFLSDPFARTYMADKFRATKAGLNNSWAYAWFYTILKNDGLCIVPNRNLIRNTGIGVEGATNTRTFNPSAMLEAQTLEFPLQHPGMRQPVPVLEAQFFYATQKQRHRLWIWYLLYRLKLRGV
jgi:hypothetical protein